jgi:hypothetical protein
MNYFRPERLLEFTPTLGGNLFCPLCTCKFPRQVDLKCHLLKEHLADPVVNCFLVAHCLRDATAGELRFPCMICPAGFRMIVNDENLLHHILTIHLAEPARLAKLFPGVKRNRHFQLY